MYWRYIYRLVILLFFPCTVYSGWDEKVWNATNQYRFRYPNAGTAVVENVTVLNLKVEIDVTSSDPSIGIPKFNGKYTETNSPRTYTLDEITGLADLSDIVAVEVGDPIYENEFFVFDYEIPGSTSSSMRLEQSYDLKWIHDLWTQDMESNQTFVVNMQYEKVYTNPVSKSEYTVFYNVKETYKYLKDQKVVLGDYDRIRERDIHNASRERLYAFGGYDARSRNSQITYQDKPVVVLGFEDIKLYVKMRSGNKNQSPTPFFYRIDNLTGNRDAITIVKSFFAENAGYDNSRVGSGRLVSSFIQCDNPINYEDVTRLVCDYSQTEGGVAYSAEGHPGRYSSVPFDSPKKYEYKDYIYYSDTYYNYGVGTNLPIPRKYATGKFTSLNYVDEEYVLTKYPEIPREKITVYYTNEIKTAQYTVYSCPFLNAIVDFKTGTVSGLYGYATDEMTSEWSTKAEHVVPITGYTKTWLQGRDYTSIFDGFFSIDDLIKEKEIYINTHDFLNTDTTKIGHKESNQYVLDTGFNLRDGGFAVIKEDMPKLRMLTQYASTYLDQHNTNSTILEISRQVSGISGSVVQVTLNIDHISYDTYNKTIDGVSRVFSKTFESPTNYVYKINPINRYIAKNYLHADYGVKHARKYLQELKCTETPLSVVLYNQARIFDEVESTEYYPGYTIGYITVPPGSVTFYTNWSTNYPSTKTLYQELEYKATHAILGNWPEETAQEAEHTKTIERKNGKMEIAYQPLLDTGEWNIFGPKSGVVDVWSFTYPPNFQVSWVENLGLLHVMPYSAPFQKNYRLKLVGNQELTRLTKQATFDAYYAPSNTPPRVYNYESYVNYPYVASFNGDFVDGDYPKYTVNHEEEVISERWFGVTTWDFEYD